MTQKKPSTNQQLAEMREMIEGLQSQEPGKVISVDRELQNRNATLMLMLYGAAAKFGVGGPFGDTGVICTTQLPVMQVPANHQLQWEVAEDGKTVMLYIVLVDSPEDSGSEESEVLSVDGGEGEATTAAVANESSPALDSIGDEFEDEIKVGMDD